MGFSMRTSLVTVAAIGSIGLLSTAIIGAPGDADALAAPVAITINGVPLDAAMDENGVIVYDNSCPWIGDFDGNGKLALLIGTRDYRFPPRGKERDGRPGRLRIYRNAAEKGPVKLAEPIWFDSLVPTGRIPQG